MKYLLIIYATILLSACNSKVTLAPRDTIIQHTEQQVSLYKRLTQIVPVILPQEDSLSFLILPLDAACPACRDKTLDSIYKFRKNVPPNHFIILSLNGGKKRLKQYFKNAGHSKIPEIPGVLFIDSTVKAWDLGLYKDNPTLYYTANGHTYRKIEAWPHTVKEDLREFFRGYRKNTE